MEKTAIKFKTNANAGGTSLKGYINIPYNELVKVLGDPDEMNGDKTLAEWCLKFEDDTIATIYDWKNYGADVETITNWHIGGHDLNAVDKIKELFPNYKVTKDIW